MACENVFDALKYASESLPETLYQKNRLMDPWQGGLVEKEAYPDGTGFEQTVITINNTEPGETSAWQAVGSVDVTPGQGACAIEREDVEWGYNERTYTLEMNGYQGPVLCKDELAYAYKIEDFMPGYINRLSQFTKRAYSFRLQEHFISLSTKYFAGVGNFNAGSTLSATAANATLPAEVPTSTVTPDILEDVAVYLNDLGVWSAASEVDNSFVMYGDSGPLYPLLGDTRSLNKILRADPERRADIQYSDMGGRDDARLLKNLGSRYSYGNFALTPNMLEPRYNLVDGALERVSAYLDSAATGKGIQSNINPAWKTAEYGAMLIPNRLVMKCQVVRPKTAGLDWDPANYMGDWDFVAGAYKWATDCVDPTEKYGRHFAEFRHAVKPIFPEYGVTIFYKRCISDPTLETCDES